MLDEFISFTQSLFPSINPYVKEQLEDALYQFEKEGKTLNLFNISSFEYLSQGDIVDGIPFTRIRSDGQIGCVKGKGMILSNTCSCDHDDAIVIAPLLPLSELKVDKNTLLKNKYYRLFYLPDSLYEQYVVDFSLMNTFNKDLLNKLIIEGKVIKEKSLNQFGFYFLLTKLTICFMRPEDTDVQATRRKDYMTLHA